MNLCDDNRFKTIEAAKAAMIKGTNIEDSPEEMKVLDSFLLRCWQMGWLDRYAPTRHFNAMPKVISERMAAGHGSNVPMQPNIPPMPSNTSNALKALGNVNATQSNTLDCISRQAVRDALTEQIEQCDKALSSFDISEKDEYAVKVERASLMAFKETIEYMQSAQPLNQDSIETQSSDLISRQAAIELCDWYDNPSMREDLEKLRPARFSTDTISRQQAIREMREVCNPSITRFIRAKLALEALQPVAIRLESKNTVDLPVTEGSNPSQIAAQIIHDAIDNTTFAEEEYPGIKEQLHRSVEEWEKLQPVFTEIAEEYKKSCEISYINKPLAHALYEVWKKHDRKER